MFNYLKFFSTLHSFLEKVVKLKLFSTHGNLAILALKEEWQFPRNKWVTRLKVHLFTTF